MIKLAKKYVKPTIKVIKLGKGNVLTDSEFELGNEYAKTKSIDNIDDWIDNKDDQ